MKGFAVFNPTQQIKIGRKKMTKSEFIDVCSRHDVNSWLVMDDLLLKGYKHPHDLTVDELNEFMWETY